MDLDKNEDELQWNNVWSFWLKPFFLNESICFLSPCDTSSYSLIPLRADKRIFRIIYQTLSKITQEIPIKNMN